MNASSKTGLFGATKEEARMALPGDEIVPASMLEATHAITINTPAEQIWPWLIQIGQGRAGFYSDSRWWDKAVDLYYRLLSHEQGCARIRYQKRDTDVVSEWQELHLGDAILDGPPGTANYVVRQIAPSSSLVLFTDTHLPYILPARLRQRVAGVLTAAYLLIPIASGTTRVVRRMRMTCHPFWFRVLIAPLVWIWGEWITAQNFLHGLKRRAEQAERVQSGSGESRLDITGA
ncbi:MAG TPA: hypothetical protein VMX38_11000 [Verrucomicrobiae bacterium]|jgi:hypothetical protein|nr:hypothetical protein [Verrucomicrobiae bacterium]